MSEPVKRSEIDVKVDKINHQKPDEINDVFNGKYSRYNSKVAEKYINGIIS